MWRAIGLGVIAVGMLWLTPLARGQSLVLKDGKVVPVKGIKRQGETVMATVELPGGEAGAPPKMGELGYAVAQVARLDFPEPTPLKTAPKLIAEGKNNEAIGELEPVVRFYEPFSTLPGSWWARAALLKAQALINAGRGQEAQPLVERVSQTATDPETKWAAQVEMAGGLVRNGDFEQALTLAEGALKETQAPPVRAAAYVVRGECLLTKNDWDEAILSFLEIPVFYPNETILRPRALLGEARARLGMDQLSPAKTALAELKKTYPDSPEAKQAAPELVKIARREKALAAP